MTLIERIRQLSETPKPIKYSNITFDEVVEKMEKKALNSEKKGVLIEGVLKPELVKQLELEGFLVHITSRDTSVFWELFGFNQDIDKIHEKLKID